MVDEQSTELDIAMELGFRIVQTGEDSWQHQKINHEGRTIAVRPTQEHAYDLWQKLVRTTKALAKYTDAGSEGGEWASPGKSTDAPRP